MSARIYNIHWHGPVKKKEDVKLVCSMEEEGQKMSYVFTFDHKKENIKSGQMLMELESNRIAFEKDLAFSLLTRPLPFV
mgnify:CR=1 FL=1